MFKPLVVRKDIYWVGALDFDIRVFDIIMHTDNGTTYNSFVVKGANKNVLFEVAKEAFFDEFYERLATVIKPEELDYIVVDHAEPDHTGSLFKLLERCKNATVVGTPTALKFVAQIANREFTSLAVKDGETLDIGGKTLKFIYAPFLHWPDSMYTYIPECRTLFTCDSFGCHYCDENVFNDKIHGDFYEAYKYYFDNIMGPFKSHVLDALKKIKDLDIETICNGHGPVIREDVQKYVDMYEKWSTPAKKDRKSIVIAYVSAYGYTAKMAKAIADAIRSAGDIDVYAYDLVKDDTAGLQVQMHEADGLLFGSPTIVSDALPPIMNLLNELNPVIHKGKIAGAFGSYGWSGEAVPNIEGRIKQLRFKIPVNGLKINFNPSEEQLKEAEAFGKAFAEALM